jgi:hypothetical protein
LIELLLYPDALVEFCLLISGLVISMLGRLLACTLWSLGAATPETLVLVALAKFSRIDRADRVDRLEDDLCRRVDAGMMVVPVPTLDVYESFVKK